jgi:type I restriction enzyme S subunit
MSGTDAWQREVPPNWTVRPLRSVAEYAVSNVDKIPSKDELPVRLCNYTDVYNNETIHLGMEFMVGTATQAETTSSSRRTPSLGTTSPFPLW